MLSACKKARVSSERGKRGRELEELFFRSVWLASLVFFFVFSLSKTPTPRKHLLTVVQRRIEGKKRDGERGVIISRPAVHFWIDFELQKEGDSLSFFGSRGASALSTHILFSLSLSFSFSLSLPSLSPSPPSPSKKQKQKETLEEIKKLGFVSVHQLVGVKKN